MGDEFEGGFFFNMCDLLFDLSMIDFENFDELIFFMRVMMSDLDC